MSAIYQRARPIRWDQVVGQEHVKDVLKAALEQGRVGHAYLFSGPRGVGKTTTARLIAMTANCTGPAPKPCGECESCLAVRAGSHPDVLEIDAASNNSVDDVRELREKVGLAAMRGGKKIYILDEAHMMSRAAFNALLKTLEEPPGHVIFILATTEPEKIIPTILSRCQHYRFRRLTPEEVAGKLAGIVRGEGASAEPAALQLIGRLADGAMRDGESLLERMLAAGNAVTQAGVEEALGLPPGEQLREMAGALVNGEAGALMQGAARLYRGGYAARTVVEGLVTALGEALHAELGLADGGAPIEGADVPRLLRLQAALDAQDSRFARSADLGSLELALTHALIAGEGSAGAASGASGGPAHTAAPAPELGQRLARLEKELRDLKASGVPVSGVPVQVAAPAAPVNIHDEIPALDEARAAPRRAASAPAPAAVAPADGNWADVLRQISPQLRAFLKPARMHAQAGYVSLTYDDKGGFHARQIGSKFEELSGVVLKVFGPVMLEVVGPTPDTSRKQQVGGRAAASSAAPAPEPVTAAPVTVPPVTAASAAAPRRAAQLNPPDDIPPFAEARAQRAAPAAVQTPPVQVAPSNSAPVSPAPASAAPVSAAQVTTLEPPPFSPAGRVPRPAPVQPEPEPAAPVSADAVSADPMPRVNDRHSPDDALPAPLPDAQPAPPAHAAEVPLRQDRAVYIEPEPIWEEPSWDDLGAAPDQTVPDRAMPATARTPRADDVVNRGASAPPAPSMQTPSPQAQMVAAQPAAQRVTLPSSAPVSPRQAPAAAPARANPASAPRAAAGAAAGAADLRGHPLYLEATKLWSGRVREVGKVRRPAAPEAAEAGAAAEDVADEDAAAVGEE